MKKVLGTIGYVAPEIANRYDDISAEKADVFSLGKTIDMIMRADNSSWESYPLRKEFSLYRVSLT